MTVGINENSSIEEVCQEYERIYRLYIPDLFKIRTSKSDEPTAISQVGITIFETVKITHFVSPTAFLLKDLKPMEYMHIVSLFNTDYGKNYSPKFTSLFHGTENDCIRFVLGEQEKEYKFDYRNYALMRSRILKLKSIIEKSFAQPQYLFNTLAHLRAKIIAELDYSDILDADKFDINDIA